MSLWRTPGGTGARSARKQAIRPEVLRLDDRIVPDATGVSPPAAVNPPSTTTPATTTTTPSADTTTTTPGTTATTPGTDTTTTTPGTDTTTTTPGTDTTTTTPPPVATPALPTEYAVGAEAGNPARVRVYNVDGTLKYDFTAYSVANYQGGVRVAMGDLNGDGVADIVTTPGAGMKAQVQVFDGVNGQRMLAFNAYNPIYRMGAYVAVADVNGDGRADIVTGAGEGGGSHVKVFDGKGLFPPLDMPSIALEPGPNAFLIREFFAYDAQYAVGARVAAADVDGDGKAEVITAPAFNGGPHVRVFAGADGTVYREWFAYDAKFAGGVFVAAGDLNGDDRAEVITGLGATGNGEVKVFDGRTNRQLRSFIVPEAEAARASVRVGAFDFDNDGDRDIIATARGEIQVYDGKSFTRLTSGVMPFEGTTTGGIFFG